ncbi:MAG: PorT family protein [Saprospiraceae bacterium]|nr:PorT family protein [Saprospiraceae bacterium]
MKKYQTPSFLFLLFYTTFLYAQKPSSLFKAGVTAGVNFTQIDGDEQFGYNRRGLNFGLRGAMILRKDMDISTELLYSERGTIPDSEDLLKKKRTATIALQYAEVPFLFNYYYSRADDGHYRWNLYAGFSYGRLLKSQTRIMKGYVLDTLQQNYVGNIGFNSSDFSFVLGAKRYFTSRIGVSLRHTFSMNYLYKNPAPVVLNRTVLNKDYTAFRSFFVSFNVFYDFITPKLSKPKKGKVAPKKHT